MSECKVYKTRECTRRAQKAYMDRLKNSEKEEDKLKWAELWKRKSEAGHASTRRMYGNPDENKESLDKIRTRSREHARKIYADPEKNAARNKRRRELRAKKKAGQLESEQIESDQLESGQIESEQIESEQIESEQIE